MRTGYFNNLFHTIIFFLSARMLTFVDRYPLFTAQKREESVLFSETNKILSIYPKLAYS